ncbi:MAG: hypothetical protein IPJ30_27450 [Acidobacteria bacterium]|nr:hypothetical protein [Acidobacteriota bacterium]
MSFTKSLGILFLMLTAFAQFSSSESRWSRLRSCDIQHVALDLRFDWTTKQVFGTASITAKPFAATDKIALDAAFLTISSIKSTSGVNLGFEYLGGDADDNLKITLERVYKPGEKLTIRIEYRSNFVNQPDPNSLAGSNGKGLRWSAPTSNDPLKPREIWSMGDPESNRYWFPSFDAPGDLRTTEISATVDRGLTAVSNGRLTANTENRDGTRTFRYRAERPYPNHLTSLVVGEFVDFRQNLGEIELHNFGYPSELKSIEATVERLPDMMRFFGELTGTRYPYQRYSQVFVQDIGSFSGNNTVSTITENMVDDFSTHADFFYLWDLTEAEALAQQWFGNYVSARDWSHVWLDKSFAHHLNGLYNEHRNGRDEFLLWQHGFDHGVYLNDWNSGIRRPIVTTDYSDAATFTGDNYSTIRGALVLQMLRKQIGESAWTRAIRAFVRKNAGRPVVTEDLQTAVEDVTGRPIDWFFDQWIYKMGHPIFEITSTYDETLKVLTLRVLQTQKTDAGDRRPRAEFFRGAVEIEIDDRVERVEIEAKAENVFRFQRSARPRLVNFDFESTWIKEVKFERSLDETLYLAENSRDALARNSAILDAVAQARAENATDDDKVRVRVVLDRIIRGKSHWRLRMAAVSNLQALIGIPDASAVETLLQVFRNDRSWLKATAIGFLGLARDQKFDSIYIAGLNDVSERVAAAAATALGRSKSPKALDALLRFAEKPSMKSQSLLGALAGLRELGDPRGAGAARRWLEDLKLPRWRLPTPPVWDYRVSAVDTIVALGKGAEIYPLLFERFTTSITEDDVNGIFNNALLISKTGDPRGQAVFDQLKLKYGNNENALKAIAQLEIDFKSKASG